MATGKRAVRVGDLILREMALLILEKVKDPRVNGVTLTEVRLSNDLKQAKVFFSVMGEQIRVEKALEGLNSARGFIKRQIGARMKLRYVPEILFVHDVSLEAGSHMEQLFEKMAAAEKSLL
ncbi:MAG: 30S ribosome-binding factor RbfA [Deltaproteobacteria bacterium]|nr:30S ribosome-binding factor RbfA [Deltaproteobacteria bacterium]